LTGYIKDKDSLFLSNENTFQAAIMYNRI